MKMKILFLASSSVCFDSFLALSEQLEERGHRCKFISPDACSFDIDHAISPWHLCNFREIEKFNPDRIVIFSGKFNSIHAASNILRRKYKTYFCELGWLPQSFNKYIDTDIQHMGSIAEYVEKVKYNEVVDKKTLFKIREIYKPKTNTLFKKDKINVLVPMQLEYDTSILYGSPIFKTMDSLIGYVASSLPHCNIIVKEHPRNKEAKRIRYDNVTYYQSGSIIDMIASSDAVVGINSTSLIEARVFHKPVYQFGCNVLQREPNKESLQDFIKYRYQEDLDNGLVALFNAQFDHRNPNPCVSYLLEQD